MYIYTFVILVKADVFLIYVGNILSNIVADNVSWSEHGLQCILKLNPYLLTLE